MKLIILFSFLFISNLLSITIDSGTTILTKKYNKNQGEIIINGGTLLLGGGNLINNSVGMTLNGGTFDTNGQQDALGTLTLSNNSTINLGNGSSLITFASLNYIGGTLTINNWSGDVNGGGTDRLIFSNTSGITQSFLNNIIFTGYGVGGVLIGNELVAVPEASTYLAALLLFILIFYKELNEYRKRIKFN